MAASLRYLNQRYVMPYGEVKGLLTDIGASVSEYDISKTQKNASVYFKVNRSVYFSAVQRYHGFSEV